MIDKDWLQQHLSRGMVVPTVLCNSGAHVSVQAGKGWCSRPATDTGPWTLVEIAARGLTNPINSHLYRFDEDGNMKPYGYIPVTLVVDIINREGGPVDEQLDQDQ